MLRERSTMLKFELRKSDDRQILLEIAVKLVENSSKNRRKIVEKSLKIVVKLVESRGETR